ncbi:MAG: CinA family nicotinamide mononucleotide deamidase-related protein [Desulfobacterales bacterium]|nr:CinA family nicotinamide mononucleotide deamidase-related protein [Desulfobacterales bacterium]
MIAEILSTGEEIRCGAVVDTNAAHIARRLEEMGVAVRRHLCVGDGLDAISRALAEMGTRADLVVVTGGLGPTQDDRTAQAAAAAAGVACTMNTAALDAMEAFFNNRGRPMTDANRKQARLPQGADWLANPVGTAPGFRLTMGECRFYFLPGVPREMRRMLETAVLPDLEKRLGQPRSVGRTRTLVTFGLTESATGEQLDGFGSLFPDLGIGFQIRFPEILVRIHGRDGSADRLESRLDEAARWACDRLGERVVSLTGASMAEVVGGLLRGHGATLAMAESCTGGLMAHWLTEVPGSSDYFRFSGVVYANAAKTAVLGVPETILARFGAVSQETARTMAEGARRVAGTDWGLATTGIAGPGGGSAEKPVGTVCIGLAGPHGVDAFRHHFPFGDRDMNKRVFAVTALDRLRRSLLLR